MHPPICVVDDEPELAETCADILIRRGFRVDTFTDPLKALEQIRSQDYFLVLADMSMPKMNGVRLFQEIKKTHPVIRVVIFTGYPSIESAVECMKEGAFDYLIKPFVADQLVAIADRALAMHRLEVENQSLKSRFVSSPAVSHTFVGGSRAIGEVLETLRKVAPLETNILITGESGTGKELVARTVHSNSKRRANPFVPINCSALPEHLLEAELFGYERGAFTGATGRSIGLFEFADHGTLFLDEIGDMALPLQAKLLRVLQEKEIRRVGGLEHIPVDVRIIASTNRDLEKMAAQKLFREDLYFRLNVVRIKVPPLRERPEDIPKLADHFLQLFNRTHGRNDRFSPEALEQLSHYRWPGNVRELENAVYQGASMADDSSVALINLPEGVRKKAEYFGNVKTDRNFSGAKAELIRRFEKGYITTLLEECKGNVTQAAGRAGLHRPAFQRLLRKYHIHPKLIKEALVVDPARLAASRAADTPQDEAEE